MSDREQRALAIGWAGRYFWHRVKFHAFHSPLYGWRLVCRSPRGLKRTLVWWGRWAFDQEARPLRQALVDAGDGSGYHRLREQRDKATKRRLIVSAAGALVVSGGLVTMDC